MDKVNLSIKVVENYDYKSCVTFLLFTQTGGFRGGE